MMHSRCALALVAILAAGSACSGRAQPGSAPPPTRDHNTLTVEELSQRPFYSAYEAVEALRPSWLNLRGPAGAIQVYVDDNPLGGVATLRTIRVSSIAVMRHLDGIQAGARYGRGHEQGVILVTTRAAGRGR